MPKPDKQIIIDFIVSCLKNGEQRGKILVKAGKKWGTSKSAFDRLLKIAKEQHTQAEAAIKEKLAKVDEQAAIDARKKAIMSSEARKEWLTKIINGEIKVKRPFVIAGKLKHFSVAPELSDRLKASAELSKMQGDYAETAFRIRGDKDNPLHTQNAIDDSQFQQLLTAARESKTSSGQ